MCERVRVLLPTFFLCVAEAVGWRIVSTPNFVFNDFLLVEGLSFSDFSHIFAASDRGCLARLFLYGLGLRFNEKEKIPYGKERLHQRGQDVGEVLREESGHGASQH